MESPVCPPGAAVGVSLADKKAGGSGPVWYPESVDLPTTNGTGVRRNRRWNNVTAEFWQLYHHPSSRSVHLKYATVEGREEIPGQEGQSRCTWDDM